ncbi:MAG: hypothetical protein CEN90_766 [Parcubacteria group bacterium Licking1014_17]|nr:MAG: hypothetical protein CEN90_766 [Parcubacteria group bacterium Licking1014_17]
MDLYEKYGNFQRGVFKRRFGSWNNALNEAGLKILKRNNIPETELIDDLKRVAQKIGRKTFSMDLYENNGQFSRGIYKRRFGSWNNALSKAGFQIYKKMGTYNRMDANDEELFSNIAMVWEKLGKQPTQANLDSNISKFHSSKYKRRFGTYNNALIAFVKWAESGGKENIEIPNLKTEIFINESDKGHKTRRDINWRLRFLTMRRDNFKCKYCGRSPATDPLIILHVDHIKAWTNGGETILENLQTLCSKCNTGKSNL